MFEAGEIYVLPNGRELMASGDGSTFYAIADNGYDLLRYELSEQSRLTCGGRLTAWSSAELRHSEQTADITARLQIEAGEPPVLRRP
jgi:hypothetical protein